MQQQKAVTYAIIGVLIFLMYVFSRYFVCGLFLTLTVPQPICVVLKVVLRLSSVVL